MLKLWEEENFNFELYEISMTHHMTNFFCVPQSRDSSKGHNKATRLSLFSFSV